MVCVVGCGTVFELHTMQFLKNNEEIQDELEALEAILEKDFSYLINEDNVICRLNIMPTDTIKKLKQLLYISLVIILPSNYPQEACICTIEKAQGLSKYNSNNSDRKYDNET